MRTFIIIITLLLLCQCDNSPITGSQEANEINVDLDISCSNYCGKEFTNTKLTVNGVATNNTNKTIYPSWKIEAQFYHTNDSGITFILGGDNYLINQSLQPNISTNFTLELNGSNGIFGLQTIYSIDDFFIDDLRAVEY